MDEIIYELLYKAGLVYLAEHLHEIEEYNLIGTTPSQIFDDMPIKLLRFLNCKYGLDLMETSEKRKKIKAVYLKQNWVFQKDFSVYQFRLMKTLIETYDVKTLFGFLQGEKKRWNDLDNMQTYYLLSQCVFYESRLRPICGESILKIRKKRYLSNSVYFMEQIYDYYSKKSLMDGQYQLIVKDSIDYEEYDSEYTILFPKRIVEILDEAISQENCLAGYLESILSGEVIILFMRKTNDVQNAYITIGIENNVIREMEMKRNAPAPDEAVDWISYYATAKNLKIDL